MLRHCAITYNFNLGKCLRSRHVTKSCAKRHSLFVQVLALFCEGGGSAKGWIIPSTGIYSDVTSAEGGDIPTPFLQPRHTHRVLIIRETEDSDDYEHPEVCALCSEMAKFQGRNKTEGGKKQSDLHSTKFHLYGPKSICSFFRTTNLRSASAWNGPRRQCVCSQTPESRIRICGPEEDWCSGKVRPP